jgi:2-polyprenyl-3-methyl-5-hydroxy-6-metoxy-1,4-benzoquinol methylase
MNPLFRWRSFWKVQSTPLHYGGTDEWYRRFAEEINSILDASGYAGGAVMESGCGNGALFGYLDINKSDYLGVDFSENMLRIFRSKYPNVRLICADASSFCVKRKFELIFSNGVVQYFDKSMLRRYVHNSHHMLYNGGILLVANVPMRHLRSSYRSGELIQEPSTSKSYLFLKELLYRFKGEDLGFWYNPKDFFDFMHIGFKITVFGSLYHPYRFSIVMKKLF